MAFDMNQLKKDLSEFVEAAKTGKAEIAPTPTESPAETPKPKKKVQKMPDITQTGPPPGLEKPAEIPADCINIQFKKLIGALVPDYIGKGDAQAIVTALLDGIPECA